MLSMGLFNRGMLYLHSSHITLKSSAPSHPDFYSFRWSGIRLFIMVSTYCDTCNSTRVVISLECGSCKRVFRIMSISASLILVFLEK